MSCKITTKHIGPKSTCSPPPISTKNTTRYLTNRFVAFMKMPAKKPVLKTEKVFTPCANSLKDGRVTFSVKNRKKNRTEPITVTATEFIRRFLLHSLPNGFVRIRHYGFLANRNRTANLNTINCLMGSSVSLKKQMVLLEEMMLKLTGIDITICPCCNKGKMQLLAELSKLRARPLNSLAAMFA